MLKTPVRLLQFPGVAVAVLAAALVLALTATSGRLFLAAAGDAAVAQELERVGGVPALALVAFGGDPAAVAAVQAEAESVARFDAPGSGRRSAPDSARRWTWSPAPARPGCSSPPGTASRPTSRSLTGWPATAHG